VIESHVPQITTANKWQFCKKDTVVSAACFKSRYEKVVNIIELMTAELTVSWRVYVFDPAIHWF